MRDYIAELLDEAAQTAIGKTWLLDRKLLMLTARAGEVEAENAIQQIERSLPWKWERQASLDKRLFLYRRLE